MKVTLACNARLPSERAHPLQVVHMWKGFSSVCSAHLLYPFRFQRSEALKKYKKEFWKYYNLQNPCGPFSQLPTLDGVHILDVFPGLVQIYSRVQQMSFALALVAWFLPKHRRETWLWSREILSLPLLNICYPKLPVFYEMHRFPGSYTELQIRWLKSARGIICLTESLRQKLLAVNYPDERILVAPDACDLEVFSRKLTKSAARDALDLPQNKQLALYAGHLYQWKGVDTIVEAMRKCRDVELHLVGGMPEDQQALRSRHDPWPANVIMHGHRPPAEIPTWLQAVDVALVPNSSSTDLSSQYTSPLKLFEAMAMEVPLIVSDLPSLREIVDDDSACLVPADDVVLWHEAIEKISSSPESMAGKVKNAKEKVNSFSWKLRAQKIIDFMKKV